MEALFVFLVLLIGVSWSFALPGIGKQPSGWRVLARTLIVLFGVVIPGVVFLLSGFMVPEWKGAARFGWLSCFHVGKFVLTPLVLWASAALYVHEMSLDEKRRESWVVLGVLNGALVSGSCLIVGFIIHTSYIVEAMFLFLPLYIAVWYLLRSRSLMEDFPQSLAAKSWTLVASIPFWVVSAFLMRDSYRRLPENPPCFVVTAASGGTPSLVGPFAETIRSGVVRSSNLQLRRFWQFEELWLEQFPRSHRIFRSVYNRVGPTVSARIRRPVVANAVYLGLKPLEYLAVAAVRLWG